MTAQDPSPAVRQINPATGICFFRAVDEPDLLTLLRAADYSPIDPGAGLEERIAGWFEYGCIYVDGQRRRANHPLKPGETVRLHTRLKRYPHPPSLKPFIAFEDGDLLILDKPSGMPTHPTLDNFIENAKQLLEAELGKPLFTTHRLDIPTQGLLILAKTPTAQVRINGLFTKGRVHKTYRAICERAVAVGTHTHYMDPEGRAPRVVSLKIRAGWWECRLRVERAQTVSAGVAHEITLLSGKTHQIRAQMSALGAPIVGDRMYGAGAPLADEAIALECYRLTFNYENRNVDITRKNSIAPELTP